MLAEQTTRITIHGGDHAHVRDLRGEAGSGIALAYQPTSLQELFPRMLTTRCYEVCEFSAANYLILRGRGENWLSALPVFPYRAFRHSLVITRRDSPFDDLAALGGKRVGVPDYSMTAAVWVRGLLRAEYGLDHRSITWVTRRQQRLPIPAGAHVEFTADDLEAELVDGRIDALLGFSTRDAALRPEQRLLRTVLPEPQLAERDYYARSGIFPIMHCVVIRNDVLARNPGLPAAVATAYLRAKQRAYANRSPSVLPWGSERWDEDMQLFGHDPLPYGWGKVNAMVIGQLASDLREQGFIENLPPLESLFLPVALPPS